MSGWDPLMLAPLTFALFMGGTGLLQILTPLPRREGAGAWPIERWSGFFGIALGFLILLWPSKFIFEPAFLIIFGVIALAGALWVLLGDPIYSARRQRRYEAELSRRALTAESYSDSLRELHANPPAGVSPLRRWVGAILFTLFGGTWLALGLTFPR